MRLPPLPPFLRRVPVSWAVALAVVALAAYMSLFPIENALRHWDYHDAPSWVGKEPGKAAEGERVYDVDTHLIHGGFLLAPTWKDTLRWWTGTWVGQVPFYRPLTSYVFYTQWRLWGDYEFRYLLVAVLLHLIAVAAYAAASLALLRHFRLPVPAFGALAAGMIFLLGLGIIPDQPSVVSAVFSAWKNQPDSLTLLFFSLTLIAYLRQREGASGRFQTALPTLGYLLICLTKEAGALLPLLLPILEWDALRAGGEERRRAIRRMMPLFLVLFLYLPYRAWCLQTAVGFQYGSNGSWPERFVIHLAGAFSRDIAFGRWDAAALTLLLFGVSALLWHRRETARPWTRPEAYRFAAGLLAAAVLVALVFSLQGNMGMDPVTGLLVMAQPGGFLRAMGGAAFLLLTALAFRQARQLAAFTYAWAILVLVLTLFSPSVPHRYYLMNAGFSVLLGAGASLAVSRIVYRPST